MGSTIEGSTLCNPVSGSIVTTTYNSDGFVSITSISRHLEEPYWTVSVMNDEESTLSDVYFARSLAIRIWRDEDWDDIGYPFMGYESEGKFHCDLTDL